VIRTVPYSSTRNISDLTRDKLFAHVLGWCVSLAELRKRATDGSLPLAERGGKLTEEQVQEILDNKQREVLLRHLLGSISDRMVEEGGVHDTVAHAHPQLLSSFPVLPHPIHLIIQQQQESLTSADMGCVGKGVGARGRVHSGDESRNVQQD
jgi:hypothetical protein